MAGSARQKIGVLALLAVAAVVLMWLSYKVGAFSGLSGVDRYELVMDDAAGVQTGAHVAIAGVPVGKVERLAVRGGQAVLTLALRKGTDVRADATALVRSRSVLGEKFVQLRPGQGAELPAGGQVALASEQYEIDQMVAQIGPLLSAIEPEQLAAAVDAITQPLADDPERVERLLGDAEAILADGRTAAAELPALVGRLERTLDRADRALGDLEGIASDLKAPVGKVDALVDDASAAIADARGALSKADAALDTFDGIAPELQTLVRNFSEIDKWELRRLLREEGILIRLKAQEVEPTP